MSIDYLLENHPWETELNKMLRTVEKNGHTEYFDSPYEFAEYCKGITADQVPTYERARFAMARSDDNGTWAGESFSSACDNVSKGNGKALAKAEQLLDKIEAEGLLSLGVNKFRPDVVGHVPIVPAVINNVPEAWLNKRRKSAKEREPVRVFIDVTVAQDVSHDALVNRGTAAIALVMALNSVRPTELYLTAAMQGRKRDGKGPGCACPIIRVNTKPLDLDATTYCLTSPAFLRRLCFVFGYKYQFDGRWAYHVQPSTRHTKHEWIMRATLGLDAQDIYIRGEAFESEIRTDPVNWLRDQLGEHTGTNVPYVEAS